MSVLEPQPTRSDQAAVGLVAGGLAVLALSTAMGRPAVGVMACVGLSAAGVLAYLPRLSWRWLLATLTLVILFIPIRRYSMPAALPFQLEPYRIVVVALIVGWGLSLLADPRVRARRTGFEAPIALILVATIGSIVTNPGRVASLDTEVLKALTFFVSFVLVLYLMLSVVRTLAAVELLVKVLVAGGAAVAFLAIFEAGTGLAPFNHLDAFLPFMHPNAEFEPALARGSRVRAMASAEHPIALGAMLVTLIPLALYLGHRVDRRWMVALALLVLGALGTLSRTGILMLVVVGIAFLVLRFRETRRLWPLIIPLLFATHVVMPGTLGSIKESFFPAGGLIEQQRSSAGSQSSAGRVDDLAPSFAEAGRRPLLGYGHGTRITTGAEANARILDDQWLATLLEIGFAGVVGWAWLFCAFIRRCGRRAKRDDGPVGWLLTAITASVAAFAIGMLTFDAFSFIQATFTLFLLLGLGAVLLRIAPAAGDAPAARA